MKVGQGREAPGASGSLGWVGGELALLGGTGVLEIIEVALLAGAVLQLEGDLRGPASSRLDDVFHNSNLA